MQVIGIEPADAENVLMELSRSVPEQIEIGRPLMVWREPDAGHVQILTTTGTWWREPENIGPACSRSRSRTAATAVFDPTLAGVLAPERVVGVETGSCPHIAVRDDRA